MREITAKEKPDQQPYEEISSKDLLDIIIEGWKHNWKYTEKVKAVMDRDPLVNELKKELKQYNAAKNKSPKLQRLIKQIEEKWGIKLTLTADLKHRHPDNQRLNQESNLFYFRILEDRNKEPIKELVDEESWSEGKMILQFDLRLLNKSSNSGNFVKNFVWNAIKKRLKKREKFLKRFKELNKLFRIRKDTLENYLRWYDLHFKERLGFRLIAFIENERKKNPLKGAELLEKVKRMGRIYKVERTIRGEDTIEKGVKTVYQLIHGKPYSKPKHTDEKYNCPIHANQCPSSCSYRIKFMARFERFFNKSYRELYFDPSKMESLTYKTGREKTVPSPK